MYISNLEWNLRSMATVELGGRYASLPKASQNQQQRQGAEASEFWNFNVEAALFWCCQQKACGVTRVSGGDRAWGDPTWQAARISY